MRNPAFIIERYKYGEHFKNKVIKLITDQYDVSIDEAKIAFDNCMYFDRAVILPMSRKYPNGIIIETDLYRQRVVIG